MVSYNVVYYPIHYTTNWMMKIICVNNSLRVHLKRAEADEHAVYYFVSTLAWTYSRELFCYMNNVHGAMWLLFFFSSFF